MRFTLQTRDLGAFDVIVSGGGIACSFEWGEPGTGRTMPAHRLRERIQEYL